MPERIPTELARAIRLVILDVDGVLTDGGIYIGHTSKGEPIELKRFEITDQIGVKLLLSAGIRVAMVSGRTSSAGRARAEELGIDYMDDPQGFKLSAAESVLARHGVAWQEVAAVCDDLADMPVLRRVGLPVAVANAVPEVRAVALWRTKRKGGHGAVREFAEALLRARGEWVAMVDAYCAERDPAGATIR